MNDFLDPGIDLTQPEPSVFCALNQLMSSNVAFDAQGCLPIVLETEEEGGVRGKPFEDGTLEGGPVFFPVRAGRQPTGNCQHLSDPNLLRLLVPEPVCRADYKWMYGSCLDSPAVACFNLQ